MYHTPQHYTQARTHATPGKLLIVDDEANGREIIAALLKPYGHTLHFAIDGIEALALARIHLPDLLLLDVMMPGLDGFAVLERLRADPLLAEIPVILVTALNDRGSRLRGLEAGADDFLSKPLDPTELVIRVHAITRLNRYRRLLEERQRVLEERQRAAEQAQQAAQVLAETYDLTLQGWVKALELRDDETQAHSARVTELTLQLAPVVGLPADQMAHVWRGALLHDIGKLGIPDEILRKPGQLTTEEMRLIQQHTIYAHEWLAPIPFLRPALEIPYYHHERWDGSGYPLGLRKETIPLAARVFAVVDVWDALTHQRPYRAAWSHSQARNYIRAHAGHLFDPTIVQVFLELIDQHDPPEST
ncbi:MAG: response regulator [Chloroflexaceae bacterium]|nr:response regulator [Chloroflexaceae bacterium]